MTSSVMVKASGAFDFLIDSRCPPSSMTIEEQSRSTNFQC